MIIRVLCVCVRGGCDPRRSPPVSLKKFPALLLLLIFNSKLGRAAVQVDLTVFPLERAFQNGGGERKNDEHISPHSSFIHSSVLRFVLCFSAIKMFN